MGDVRHCRTGRGYFRDNPTTVGADLIGMPEPKSISAQQIGALSVRQPRMRHALVPTVAELDHRERVVTRSNSCKDHRILRCQLQ